MRFRNPFCQVSFKTEEIPHSSKHNTLVIPKFLVKPKIQLPQWSRKIPTQEVVLLSHQHCTSPTMGEDALKKYARNGIEAPTSYSLSIVESFKRWRCRWWSSAQPYKDWTHILKERLTYCYPNTIKIALANTENQAVPFPIGSLCLSFSLIHWWKLVWTKTKHEERCYAYVICILKSHNNYLIFLTFIAYFVLKQ